MPGAGELVVALAQRAAMQEFIALATCVDGDRLAAMMAFQVVVSGTWSAPLSALDRRNVHETETTEDRPSLEFDIVSMHPNRPREQ